MSKLHGKQAFIYNAAQKIVSLRDLTVTIDHKVVDSTDHDSAGWEEVIAGNKKWSATSQHAKVLLDASQDALYDALVAGTAVTINIYPNGIASGQPQYAGTAQVSKWDYKAPNQDLQDITIQLDGVGALVRSVQP